MGSKEWGCREWLDGQIVERNNEDEKSEADKTCPDSPSVYVRNMDKGAGEVPSHKIDSFIVTVAWEYMYNINVEMYRKFENVSRTRTKSSFLFAGRQTQFTRRRQ